MHPRRVLIVEDDCAIHGLLTRVFEAEEWSVATVTTGRGALDHLREHPADLVLTDLRLPDLDGVTVVARILAEHPSQPIIVMTGYGTVECAVDAMRAGAVDFIPKPLDLKSLMASVNRAITLSTADDTGSSPSTGELSVPAIQGLVGESAAMQKLVGFVHRVADSDSTVLITGESGTGKEVLARALHTQSRRSNGPLIPINCGAIPEALLESELFGHERGAFSGAHAARAGRFEMAHGGTLFLDEIGELPLVLQVKLLRALQERSFERVGGTKPVKVDVRIIAATNADLEAAVRDGRFRKDLYYRLNVIPIVVPPLRARVDDIPVLIQHFIQRLNARTGAGITGIDDRAVASLTQYEWPGNVRELENLIERLVVLKREGIIDQDDLPEPVQSASHAVCQAAVALPHLSQEGIDLMRELEVYENRLILSAMTQAGGITSKAARLLRLNRTTLVEKLKRKKLDLRLVVEQAGVAGSEPVASVDQPSMF